jgi:hypothetical protein
MEFHLSRTIRTIRCRFEPVAVQDPNQASLVLDKFGFRELFERAGVEPKHFRLMMACAEICRTSAHFMLLNTPTPQAHVPRMRRNLHRVR